jgi:thioredoxin reductase (NADPH)
LIEAGAGGPVLIGPEGSPDVVRLQGFLARNAYPHQLLDPAKDPDAAKLVQHMLQIRRTCGWRRVPGVRF